ncbi:MAG: hypothetical protein OXI34_03270 [Chloroflexota bacterium]|nr:hypothetical protein [Chloroflexota bacterium]MDE2947778.1 hypothetical protein [Chloroflexota bacterium]
MNLDLGTLAALVGSIAAFLSALFVFYKWAEDQDNAKHEQLRRDISNEVRAEIYKALLELDSVRLLQNRDQRETLVRLSDKADDQASENKAD